MKQTTVEWLVQQVNSDCLNSSFIRQELVDKAKEMEKEQMFEYIKKNYVNGENSLKFHTKEFEQYYNDTFKSE